MSSTLSRRSLAKGIAWTVPAVALATSAPAYAASSCVAQVEQAFADAQRCAEASYYCNGQPARPEINFYQPPGSLNGYVQDAYVNVKNLSGCNITFSQQFPLQLSIQVRNNNVVNNTGRAIGRVLTSWGDRTWDSYNIANQPVGSVNHNLTWTFYGSDPLPGNGLGDNEADLVIGFNDGIAGLRRWNDYITVTPLQSTRAPTMASIGIDQNDPACVQRYNELLSQWKVPFDFVSWGPLNPDTYQPGTNWMPVQPGQTVDSRVTGNGPWGGGLAAYRDGIF